MIGPERRWFSKLLDAKEPYFCLTFYEHSQHRDWGSATRFTPYTPVDYLYDLDKKKSQTIILPEYLVYATKIEGETPPNLGIDECGQLFGFDIAYSHLIIEMFHILKERYDCAFYTIHKTTNTLPSFLTGSRNVAFYQEAAEMRTEMGEDYVYYH
jgi:hypothetical protein